MHNCTRYILAVVCLTPVCWGQADLTQLSLEDLGNVKVMSASRKSESLSSAPAAIYVLAGDDIREGGYLNLPDALRTVPGLYVAQTDSHIWQISARGFSDLNNNKMLVLVDGRSVYTPLYGGVYWDALDIPLENIDRVEVIRGPGGTLWGANAVNGVINIVTKAASDADGALISASLDKDEGYTATLRYGGSLGSRLGYYVYGRASYWEPLQSATGQNIPNRLMLPQGGLRLDWSLREQDTVSLQAGTYDGRLRTVSSIPTIPMNALLKGSNVGLQWKHAFSPRSSSATAAYCDWYSRLGFPGESRNTCDIEFQHDFEFNARNSLIWGGAVNTTGDDVSQDGSWFAPLQRRNTVGSAFVQYGFVVVPDRLRVIGGTKLEHNGYTGFEYQPQIRAVWTPSKTHNLWTSVSRAVRVPSRGESDLQLQMVIPGAAPGGLPLNFSVTGSNTLESEHLRAYEAGYRLQDKSFTLDCAVFYNDYNNRLVQLERVSVSPSGMLLNLFYANHGTAQSHGAELAAEWLPVRRWKISGGMTEMRGSPDALGGTPRHLFNVQSQVHATSKLDVHSAVFHYAAVPLGRVVNAPNLPIQSVPSFDRVDFGGSWRLLPEWTLGLWGRNLITPRHVETRDSVLGNVAGAVPRSVEFRLIWQHGGEDRGKK